MAGTMNRLFGFLLIAIALIHTATAQTTHVVGGSAGWSVPSPTSLYSDWASAQTFTVGDSLTFNFASGRHDVATVTQAAYDACDITSTIGAPQMTGPVTITLTSPGTQYYFCAVQGHCTLGQKLSINVVAAAASPPPTTASPPPPRTATPPPRSASPPPPRTATPPPRSAPPPTPTTVTPPPRSSPPPPTTTTITPPPTSAIPPTPSTVSPPTPAIATPPTTSNTPTTTSTVPPPPPNSASQLTVVSFSATFLFAAATLLF